MCLKVKDISNKKVKLMQVKTMYDPCWNQCIFNLALKVRKIFIKIAICVVLLSAFTIGHGNAGVWKDLFDEPELIGWERIVEDNPWFASWEFDGLVPGILIGTIEQPKQEQVIAADFLHWNAHQFQLNKVTVVGEEIHYTRGNRNNSGEFCLFLGQRQPEPDFAAGYIFSPEKTTKMQFSANGVYKIGEVKANYDDRFRLTSGHLKVVFDAGKFQLYTQNILITEFFDPEVPMIDVAGLMVVHKPPGSWFDATISTFSISGNGIPNHNSLDVQMHETQLTTIWGALKRF